MTPIALSIRPELRNILNDLKHSFLARTDAEAVQHALLLVHALTKMGADDVVQVLDSRDPQRRTWQNLYLPMAPWYQATKPNQAFKDRHKGQRCFIVLNGPSIAEQDLRLLKGELTFFVSNGYLHTHYDELSPTYHCSPQFTYSGTFTREVAIEWLKEMDARIGQSELFLNISEQALIQECGLFPDRPVNYVCLGTAPFEVSADRRPFDISRNMPEVQTVSMMAIMLAMYMGFTEIHLLGADHDTYRTNEYKYPFTAGHLQGSCFQINYATGQFLRPKYDALVVATRIWHQYRVLKEIAAANGISILNATAGGDLDEFPRIALEEAVRRPHPTATVTAGI